MSSHHFIESIWDNHWLEIIARWAVGMTFVYASVHKIMSPARFAEIVCGYLLFPEGSINLIAVIVPFLELFAGIALITGLYPRSAALLVTIMLLAFIAVLCINLIRGIAFDCGCISFGETERSSVAASILQDLILLVLSCHVLFYRKTRKWCVRQSGSVLRNL